MSGFQSSLSTGRRKSIICYGTHDNNRQRINKSNQEEYKIWVLLAEVYGYVVQFRPWKRAKKGKQFVSSTKW